MVRKKKLNKTRAIFVSLLSTFTLIAVSIICYAFFYEPTDNNYSPESLPKSKNSKKTTTANSQDTTDPQQTKAIYTPDNKRDPFRSFDFNPRIIKDNSLVNELSKFDYNELTVTAIIMGIDSPKVLIEDKNSNGHTLEIGSRIGKLNGIITEINKDNIVIVEESIDYDGSKKTRTIDMFLHPQEESDK